MSKIKELTEKRNTLVEEMKKIIDTAKTETRALTEEENARFQAVKDEIDATDITLKAAEEAHNYEMRAMNDKGEDKNAETRALDERFMNYIRGETRALDIGDNGGVIPAHIANRIIETVKDMSPIYSMVTVFMVGGDLVFPVWLDSHEDSEGVTRKINAAYVGDMEELTDSGSKFTTVKLENHIVGVLTKISKSLINRTDLDVLSFLIRKTAESLVEFLERELIVGTEGKMQGVLSATKQTEAASATMITADNLIDLQMSVPEVFQSNSAWIMNRDTLKAIRKLKDGNGNFLLNKDATTAFGWEILGRRVLTTDSMPKVGAGALPVAFGDYSGLYLKHAQNIELQVLAEKYATQHALGIVGYMECDSKIIEPQKIALLKMGS